MLLALLLVTGEKGNAQSCTLYPSPQERFGFNVSRENGRRISDYDVAPLNAHWYLDYATQRTPPPSANMAYAQMLRPSFWQSANFTTTVEAILQNNPGALWIVGNEPDRDKQDNQTPSQYAVFYHDVYTFLKSRDPSAHLATAGVIQSTPLRRRYLDMVLTEYQSRYGEAMPVDVWTVHGFILSENNPVWGAWNPPGLDAFANEGIQYTVAQHGDINIFKNNLIAFRQWMADRGYRNKPLLLTEYGILLSPLHGYSYAKVKSYMLSGFDFLLTATDANTGYPADGNRLVQAWSWFSLNYPPYDPETEPTGQNGNLMTPDTGVLEPLGQDFGAYINSLTSQDAVTLTVPTFQLTPPYLVMTDTISTTTPMTFTATLANIGNHAACNVTIRLDHQDPQGQRTRITTQTIATLAPTAKARTTQSFTFTWQPPSLELGRHKLILSVEADNSNTGLATVQMREDYAFQVVARPLALPTLLPLIRR